MGRRDGIKSRIMDIILIITLPLLFTVGFGIYQSVRPERVASSITPQSMNLAYEDVTLTTEDGLKLAAWYVPRTDAPTDSAVIILHGYPADKGDLVRRTAFLALDYNLLFVDFRYFGGSEGNISTVGAKEVMDLLAAVDYLKKERGMRRIGVYGFSMGGAVGIMALERTDDIDAVASEAAYAELRMMAEDLYRNFGPLNKFLSWMTAIGSRLFLKIDIDDTSPAKAAAETDVPILIIHSRADNVISFRNAELLQEALSDNSDAEFQFADFARHGEASANLPAILQGFFSKHLK